MRVFSRIQVVVHGRGEQQRRDGRQVACGVAVGEHDEASALGDGHRDLAEDLLEAGLHRGGPTGDVVQSLDDVSGIAGQVTVRVDVDDLGQLVVVEHRERQDELSSGCRAGGERIALRTDDRAQ